MLRISEMVYMIELQALFITAVFLQIFKLTIEIKVTLNDIDL